MVVEHLHCMQCNLVYVPEMGGYIPKEQHTQIFGAGTINDGTSSGLCSNVLCRMDNAFEYFQLNKTPDHFEEYLRSLLEELR